MKTSEANPGISKVHPFLKWAGGKRWLVTNYSHFLPQKFGTYIEPFLGGGAVYFHLCPEKAILGDANMALIETYKTVRDSCKDVAARLHVHAANHMEKYYYEVRSSRPTSAVGKAAQFIYLNKACFNGLYRVNRSGKFNVPIGQKVSPEWEESDLESVSRVLQGVELLNEDFEVLIDRAKKGDFLYVDPPYTVKHNNNNFLMYNEKIFSWADQERLAKAVRRAGGRGVQIVVSNADHNCIHDLYRGFGVHHRVYRKSLIAADADQRKDTSELVITNVSAS